MADRTFYDVLGVDEDVEAPDLRRAYLRLARDHHPDRVASDPSATAAAEARMRELNEAWSVLGDPARRAEYDRRLAAGSSGVFPNVVGADGPVVRGPSRDFTPYHEHDEDDDDAWRYEPDEYDPRTGLGRGLSTATPLAVLGGLGILALALILGGRLLVVGGLVVLVGVVVMFVGAPVLAMTRGQDQERRVEAERRRGERP